MDFLRETTFLNYTERRAVSPRQLSLFFFHLYELHAAQPTALFVYDSVCGWGLVGIIFRIIFKLPGRGWGPMGTDI